MKIVLISLFISISTMLMAQFPVLNIGDQMPKSNMEMKSATTGNNFSLKSIKNENGLLVVFSCNTCPFVIAWEDRYSVISELASANKIGFALVNSNDAKRDGADSFDAMKTHASDNKYAWPYLLDEKSVLANAFGAQTTPHVFLFDKNNKLVYKGAIDDNHKDAKAVTDFYLKDAIQSLASGNEIANKETHNLGCSIKRTTN